LACSTYFGGFHLLLSKNSLGANFRELTTVLQPRTVLSAKFDRNRPSRFASSLTSKTVNKQYCWERGCSASAAPAI